MVGLICRLSVCLSGWLSVCLSVCRLRACVVEVYSLWL